MRKRIDRRIVGLMGVLFFCGTASVWAAATLENPAPGALKSGVGVISGWVCDAEELEVSFDGGPRTFVPYGSERVDTEPVCGDSDNGFGLLWNYNELGDGPHTVTLYADGMIQTQVNFNVTTLGTNFLRGVTGQGTITLSDGKQVNVQWEETTQGFTITGYEDGSGNGGGGSENGNQAGRRTSDPSAHPALGRLLGVWAFAYAVGAQTYTSRFYLDEIFFPADGSPPSADGFTSSETYILAYITHEIYPSYTGPYQYVAFTAIEPTANERGTCFILEFNLTASTRAIGILGIAERTTTGECINELPPIDTVGTRGPLPQ